jgi:DnaJ-class molecular chaperone
MEKTNGLNIKKQSTQHPCPKCHGRGKTPTKVHQDYPLPDVVEYRKNCESCNGYGVIGW